MICLKRSVPRVLLLSLAVVTAHAVCAAQASPLDPQAPRVQQPSSLVQPALDALAHAGSAVDLNHWKGSAAARDEVDANLASMQKDVRTTLPPLLSAADAAPASAAASLPLLLNLDALYSVLLRVSIAAHTGAPRDQAGSLEQAAALLDNARRDLGDAVLAKVQASEAQVTQLSAALRAATPPAQPVAPVKAAPATKVRKRSPAAVTH